MPEIYDEPFSDSSQIPTFLISKFARQSVTVSLSGDGGDEVFAGYSNFRTIPRMEMFANAWKHLPGSARHSLGSAFDALVPVSDQNRKLTSLIRDNGRLLHPYFLTRMLFTPRQVDLLCPPADTVGRERAVASQRENLQAALSLDTVNRVSYLEMRCYMLNTLLRDADFMSMSQGLEVRVPLIDHQLAKAVLALPGAEKLNGHTPKKLLVAALESSLPDQVVRRRKRGFTLPFEHWLRGELRREVEPVLEGKFSERQMRLWAVACCRRVAASLADPRSRRAVDTADRFADGLADCRELERAGAAAADARAERQPEAEAWGEATRATCFIPGRAMSAT